MADEIDLSAEQNEIILEALLKVRKPEPGPLTGKCLFCGENVPHLQRYCDVDCAQDHEKEVYFRSQKI